MIRKFLPAILLVVAAAFAHADKISGFVKGAPSGRTFQVGTSKGTYTVDASKAKVTLKGKFFALSGLTGGSQVTVEGTLKGMNMMAKMVSIGNLRAAGKPVAATMKPAPKKMDSKPSKTMKPKMDDKMSKTSKTMKPKTDTKTTKTTKSKTDTKAKTDSKTTKTDTKKKKTDTKTKTGGN
ncbi:MAG: hypothetical protein JST12_12715 [Armatimonadetes bacterium]|nr:hypothetical protein [Armatimonadota bacterium]MBS1702520.1 hypothetical protein [Armatimonadota bacterium]MBS1725947.1 hypothetical protein [Armatimonadota bacterium]